MDFFSLSLHPDWLWGLPSFLSNGYWGSFPRVKWAEHEAEHSHPSMAKVKNVWSYTSTSSIHFHGMVLT
jgi:hypothetical protein